jgi:subtilisin family serine protease/Leucine-rich repeat (LRR) protein
MSFYQAFFSYAHRSVLQCSLLLVALALNLGLISFAQAATDCNAVTEISTIECESLLQLYHSTNGTNWKTNNGWNTNNIPCSWFAVSCKKNSVTSIDLRFNNLSGTLPNFRSLPNLSHLLLASNQLTGTIPDFTGLSNLYRLQLISNNLTGTIPNFSGLPNLGLLELSKNQLTGTIPDFSGLPQLKWLNLDNNQLTGTIPNFSNLINLSTLRLDNNQLIGTIPNLNNLIDLGTLYLNNNQLNGAIPNFINLSNLVILYLHDNKLTGAIPDFGGLSKLEVLNLKNNTLCKQKSIDYYNWPIKSEWQEQLDEFSDCSSNQSPTAICTASPMQGEPPLTVTLDASSSYDPDGTIVSYEWSVNGIPLSLSTDTADFTVESTSVEMAGDVTITKKTTTITFTSEGDYTIALTVTDDDGATATDQKTITVTKETLPVNQPPIAAFTASPQQGQAPLTVTLDASDSYDPDGTIVSYDWSANGTPLSLSNDTADFTVEGASVETVGDITIARKTTTMTFTSEGDYTIALTVTDDDGATAIAQKTITVESSGRQAGISISPTSHTFDDTLILSSSLRNRSRTKKVIPTQADYLPNRVIVKFREGTQSAKRRSLRSHINAKLIKKLPLINAEAWEVENVKTTLAIQNDYPEIEYIEPDYVRHTNRTPNDADFSQLWGLHNIGQTGGTTDADIDAEEAWDIATGNDSIVCAVIDTGIDYNHPDLVDNMWQNPGEIPNNGIDDDGNGYVDDVYGYDFANDDGDPFDDQGHGTHVAGTIAGIGNNREGVTGINWSAKIMALKFLGHSGGSTTDAILAVQYATKMGIKCTNNSWGGGGYSQSLYDVIEAAEKAGQLFMAAAGNDYGRDTDDNPHYPSSYDLDNIISVCSTDHHDELSVFSNLGQRSVDLCAPGSRILSTVPNKGYDTFNGTSMATPHVTGAVMLLWSAFPHLTAAEVKTHIMSSVERLGSLGGTSVTGGRLNLHHALTSVPQAQQTFTVTSTGDANLIINQVKLTGTNATEFQIRNDRCSSQTVVPGDNCTVDILFVPTSMGSKQALLEISSNATQTATASLNGNGITIGDTGELTIKWAEPSSYQIDTSEVEIPTVAVGSDIFRAKLCPAGASLRFQLCDFAEVNADNRLGDTTYNATTGIVNIPSVKIEGFSIDNSKDIVIEPQFYEVDLQTIPLSDGNLEFEVIKLIPIW